MGFPNEFPNGFPNRKSAKNVTPPGLEPGSHGLEADVLTIAPQVLSHPPVLLSPIRKSGSGALLRIWRQDLEQDLE